MFNDMNVQSHLMLDSAHYNYFIGRKFEINTNKSDVWSQKPPLDVPDLSIVSRRLPSGSHENRTGAK
jgi:hypothetical protein